jgi:hypothetical protein
MRPTLGKNLAVRFTIAPSTANSASRRSTPPSIVQADPPTCPRTCVVKRVPSDADERRRRSNHLANTPCAARNVPCVPSDRSGQRYASARAHGTQGTASAGCSASSMPTQSRSAPNDRSRGVLQQSRSHRFPCQSTKAPITFAISVMLVCPVNSNFTLPRPEKYSSSSASKSNAPAVSTEKATILL